MRSVLSTGLLLLASSFIPEVVAAQTQTIPQQTKNPSSEQEKTRIDPRKDTSSSIADIQQGNSTSIGAANAQLNLSQIAAKLPFGKVITVGDVYTIWTNIPKIRKSENFEKDYRRLLLLLIDQENVVNAAKDKKIPESKEFKKKKDDMISLLWQKLYMDTASKELAKKDQGFSAKEQKTFDDKIKEHPDFGDEEFTFRHIIFQKEGDALTAYREIASGGEKKFDEKSKAVLKPGASDILKLRKKVLPSSINTTIGAQKNGLVPLINGNPTQLIPGTFSVLWIVERSPVPLPKIDSKEGQEIAWEFLKAEYLLKALEEARRSAQIQLIDPNGKEILDQTKPDPSWTSIDFDKIDPKLVVAKFGSKEIGFEQMKELSIDLLKGDKITSENYIAILQYVVDRNLIQDLAIQHKIPEKQETKEAVETMTRGLLQSAYFDDVSKQLKLLITQDELRQAYTEFLKISGDMTKVRIRHILVKGIEKAKKILKSLQENPTSEGFKTLVKENLPANADEETRKREGDLGENYIRIFPEEIAKEIKSVAAGTTILKYFPLSVALPDGSKISDDQKEFLFIRVEDKKVTPVPQIKDIEDKLKDSLAKKKITKEIEKLRNDKVECFNLKGEPEKFSEFVKVLIGE